MKNKVNISHRTECRMCRSKRMANIFSFPAMPLRADLITSDLLDKKNVADLDIYACLDCYTVQTQHDVVFDGDYTEYLYSTSASDVTSRFMECIASELTNKYFTGKGQKILEIGSNDGSQLLSFKQLGWSVLGYEPSYRLSDIAISKGIQTIRGLFNKDSINKIPHQFKDVDMILLSYTFDHLPDPMEFVQLSKLIINPAHGLLVIEVHDLKKMFQRGEYCLFAHEHSIYLTRATAQTAMEREGFVIIDFDIVPEAMRRANSLIFVATPSSSIFSSMKTPLINPPEFQDITFYISQVSKIRQSINRVERFIENLNNTGKKIAGYGAGGRGVLMLAMISNADKIKYMVDKNPAGSNMFTPKSHLPVFGIEQLRESPVDEIIVFSFGYMNEIRQDVCALGYSDKQLHSIIDILGGNWS